MKFGAAQRGYSATERELAAIRWGLESFTPFIYGVSIILHTDHKPLIYMYNMAAENSRISRTLQDIAEYDFEIRYLPGVKNDAADFLSRLEFPQDQTEERETGLPKELRILAKLKVVVTPCLSRC